MGEALTARESWHRIWMARSRRGSKPARDALDGYPNDGRAEFFALPLQS